MLQILTPGMSRPSLFILYYTDCTLDFSLCHLLLHHIYLMPPLYPVGPTVLHNCLSLHFPVPIGSTLVWPYDKITFVSSPLPGRLPHLSFVLCSPRVFFPQTEIERNSFRFLSMLSVRALLLQQYVMGGWKGSYWDIFHQSLTNIFALINNLVSSHGLTPSFFLPTQLAAESALTQ